VLVGPQTQRHYLLKGLSKLVLVSPNLTNFGNAATSQVWIT